MNGIDPNIKFKRVRQGYDPQEVDAVFDHMQREISDLKRKNISQSYTISQYDEKIGQLAQTTRQLEDERTAESLRLTGLMNTAAILAEQTKLDAQREAEKIIQLARLEAAEICKKARVDSQAAQASLTHIQGNMQTFGEGFNEYALDVKTKIFDLNALLEEAITHIPAEMITSASSPAVVAPAYPEPTAAENNTVAALPKPSESDLYEAFLKNAQLEGMTPSHSQSPRRGACLGHFGD